MRKTIFFTLILIALTYSSQAQIISEFTWDSNPVTQAAIGPNGTSASSTAASSTGGNGGTNGLNAGTGGNIDLIVPGSVFEIPGIDVSIDFQKEENGASFFALGGLDFGISTGAIYAKLPFTSGVLTLNSIAAVPATGWHTYRFVYNNNTGNFTVSVDGVTSYNTNIETGGTALSWTGATTVTIGGLMDGSGSNKAELDNLIVQSPPVILPLQLLSFDAVNQGTVNRLQWAAAQETQLLNYTIERSADGLQFDPIGSVTPQQDHAYAFVDNAPSATSYYRLTMTDVDGASTYSAVKKVSIATEGAVSLACFPNPAVDYAYLRFDGVPAAGYRYSVFAADGRLLQNGAFTISGDGQQVGINLSTVPKGMLFIRLQSDEGAASTLELLKK